MSEKSKIAQQQELDNDQMEQVAGGYYRPAPTGDGTTEHFFTVEIAEGQISQPQPSLTTNEPEEGRIAYIKQPSPEVSDPAS